MTIFNKTSILNLGLLCAVALCGACDAPAELADDGAVTLRNGGGGGITLNTLTLGAQAISELDLHHGSNGATLEEVMIVVHGEYIVLDELWSEDGEFHGLARPGEPGAFKLPCARQTCEQVVLWAELER